jgi:hypothetical protein
MATLVPGKSVVTAWAMTWLTEWRSRASFSWFLFSLVSDIGSSESSYYPLFGALGQGVADAAGTRLCLSAHSVIVKRRNAVKSPVAKFVLSLIITALCAGCASFGYQRETDLSSHLPLGIVTVLSNYNIYWDDEDPGSSNRPQKKETPERTRISRADKLIVDAEAILQQSFADAGITDVVPKDTIIESQAYKDAKRRFLWNNNRTVLAEGYEPINYGDKKFAMALARETGVRAGVYIIFDFSKAMASGIGKSGAFRAQVYMTVIIVDSTGRIIYKRDRFVTSADKIQVSFRYFNEAELIDIFRSTIANACYLFIQEFAAANDIDMGI